MTENPFENCLLPLLKALGWRGNFRFVKEAMPHFSHINTPGGFCEVLENLHFTWSALTVTNAEIDSRLLPALFVSSNKDVLVILSKKGNHYTIYNGNLNEENRMSVDVFSRTFPKGTCYFFKFKKSRDYMVGERSWFWDTIRANKGLIANAIFLSFILSFLMLATPLFVMGIYDEVIDAASYKMLGNFSTGISIALISMIYIYRIRGEHLSRIGAYFGKAISNQIMRQLLYLAPVYTETATTGAQVARIKDFDKVREFMSGSIISVFFDLPFILLSLIFITILGGNLVFVPIGMIGFFILISFILSIKINALIKQSAAGFSQLQEFLLESIESIRVLKYTSSVEKWSNFYREKSAAANLLTMRLTVYDGISNAISDAIVIFSGMLILAFGAKKAMNGNLDVGILLALMMIVWRTLSPIKSIVATLPRLLQLTKSVKQIDRLMALHPETKQIGQMKQEKITFRGSVSFIRVSMRYPNAYHPSLLGVNFEIEAGSFIAITGRNGSGKSTVLKLILSMYQPQAGAILIDGKNIGQLDPLYLRTSLGYLPQRPELFYGTIEDNLRLGDLIVSEEALLEATRNAGILETILSLPQGFSTKLYDQTAQRLSSSFSQSLCLARVYLRDAPILLLDEPGNTLDKAADEQLVRYLESLKGKRTIIMVTHRPSHLNKADKLFLMEQGQLVLQGPPEETLQKISFNLL